MRYLLLALHLMACTKTIPDGLGRTAEETPRSVADSGVTLPTPTADTASAVFDAGDTLPLGTSAVSTSEFSGELSVFSSSDAAVTALLSSSAVDATSGDAAPAPPESPSPDAGIPPDAAPPPAECAVPAVQGSECGLLDNCGCTAGRVCRVADRHTGQTLCFDAGPRPSYASCDVDQACAAGAVCEAGLCRPSCQEAGTFCADDAWCGPLYEGGRTVCQGHCNVLPHIVGVYSTSAFWVEQQVKLHERGFSTVPRWELDYVPCGEGGYCHPGSAGLTPFPFCVMSQGVGLQGATCLSNAECADGYGCAAGTCAIWGYTDDSCPEGMGTKREGVDPLWLTPDSYSSMRVCVYE